MSNEELSRTKNNSRLSLAKKAKFDELYTQYYDMDADHATAWSKGGATSPENCQMLCKHHIQSKGNK